MVHLLRGASFRPGEVLVVNHNPDAVDRYRELLPRTNVESFSGGVEIVRDFVTELIS
jgi:hypothetical protein